MELSTITNHSASSLQKAIDHNPCLSQSAQCYRDLYMIPQEFYQEFIKKSLRVELKKTCQHLLTKVSLILGHEIWETESIRTTAALTGWGFSIFCNVPKLPHGGRNSSTSCWTQNPSPLTSSFQENHLLESSQTLIEESSQTWEHDGGPAPARLGGNPHFTRQLEEPPSFWR